MKSPTKTTAVFLVRVEPQQYADPLVTVAVCPDVSSPRAVRSTTMRTRVEVSSAVDAFLREQGVVDAP
jgi:hypothetical protein